MKSWKTTAAGGGTILATIGTTLNQLTDGNPATSPDWNTVIPLLFAGLIGLFSRDNGVTSEQVGASKPSLIILALLIPCFGFAADAPPAKVESGPTIQFQTFGVVQTYDLDRGKGGVGVSAVVNFTDYLGAEVEGYSFGKEGVAVDRGAASLRYNLVIPNSKTRPYGFGGAWYNFEEQDAYGFHAGVGIAHQFAKFFTPFADVRFSKPLNGSDTATSCIARAGLSIGF